ncbi:histidine kinase, partial [candidate division KSB1 bacterium]|nr:histidine kinase [candidate division KSB1 bacterium]
MINMKEVSLLNMHKILRFALLLLSLPLHASAQSISGAWPALHPETGRPNIRNYSPKEYGAMPQNWAIIQDQRGVMYFGNWNGVLEYDGVTWRLIPTPNKSGVRSFAMDEHGRLYVGAVGDLGYLAPDSLGQLQFVSLLDHVAQEGRGFNEVWYTYATSQGVYFGTDRMLLRWDGSRMRSWKASTLFSRLFMVRDRIFLRQWDVG